LGVRVVPLGRINKVEKRLKELRVEWDEAVAKFVDAYPELVKKAALRLGPVYHAEDYPPAEDVKSKFSFTWRYVNFGVPGTLKNVAPEVFEEQLEEQKQLMIDAAEEYKQNRRALL